MVSLNINGVVREVDADPDTPLLWVIREQVGLTGTKYGCGVAQCGACAVHIDGEVQRSCSIRAAAQRGVRDRAVTRRPVRTDPSHGPRWAVRCVRSRPATPPSAAPTARRPVPSCPAPCGG